MERKNMTIMIAGSALLLLLSAAKAISPKKLRCLPLGGSNIAEIGIVLAVCLALMTLVDLV